MSDLRALASIAALSVGVPLSALDDPTDYASFRRKAAGPAFPPAPPKPLTKRQKRRLRGKAKEQSA